MKGRHLTAAIGVFVCAACQAPAIDAPVPRPTTQIEANASDGLGRILIGALAAAVTIAWTRTVVGAL